MSVVQRHLRIQPMLSWPCVRLLVPVIGVAIGAVGFVAVGVTMQVYGNNSKCPANTLVLDMLRVEGGFLMVFGLSALQFPCAAVAREEADPQMTVSAAVRYHIATGRFSGRARVVLRFMIFFATVATVGNIWATQNIYGSQCTGCREPYRAGVAGTAATGCDQDAYGLARVVNVTVWVTLSAPLVAGLLFGVYSFARQCWRRRKEARAERLRALKADALQVLTRLRSANYQVPIAPVTLRSVGGDCFAVEIPAPCSDPCSELHRLRSTDLRQLAVEQHPELASGCRHVRQDTGRASRLVVPWNLLVPGIPRSEPASEPVTLEQLLQARKTSGGDPVVIWDTPAADTLAISPPGSCTIAPPRSEAAVTDV